MESFGEFFFVREGCHKLYWMFWGRVGENGVCFFVLHKMAVVGSGHV